MSFEFRDEWINQYWSQGFVIFRNILPTSLVKDLRREAEKGRVIARQSSGPRAQRIQPVVNYEGKLDLKPFKDYAELPVLRDAVHKLLTPQHTHASLHVIGILLEPDSSPWNLGWHRDGPVEVPIQAQDQQLMDDLARDLTDIRAWNQVNCALYADGCTWYVPGSHLRVRNLPGERQTKVIDHNHPIIADAIAPAQAGPLPTVSNEELERLCLDVCTSFPGAVQIQLNPGDYLIYRNPAWHNGNYRHYQPRATIHDIVNHPDSQAVWSRWVAAKKAALERMAAREQNK